MGIEAHSEQFTIQGPTHKLPYEPDKFSVKPILMVPFAVIATGIGAFIITTLIFDNIFDPAVKETSTFQEAATRGQAPLNERMARISSTDPKADVNAPRLEWVRVTEPVYSEDDKEKKNPLVTSEWTTALPKKTGNSPEYHPEDLRADRQPGLTGYAKSKDGLTKIPVDKAMDLITGGLVGVQPNAKPLPINADWDRPKESNGGQPTTKK
ncbi:hypothetical protein [Zavarzinella formosa]|uniref:hypothetical protein n=1 Tax=Zavarzinella formosa TaxID=360055 RepID=UPI0002FD03BD|nr:hypothetical protein [Zavarzinella formosa]